MLSLETRHEITVKGSQFFYHYKSSVIGRYYQCLYKFPSIFLYNIQNGERNFSLQIAGEPSNFSNWFTSKLH